MIGHLKPEGQERTDWLPPGPPFDLPSKIWRIIGTAIVAILLFVLGNWLGWL